MKANIHRHFVASPVVMMKDQELTITEVVGKFAMHGGEQLPYVQLIDSAGAVVGEPMTVRQFKQRIGKDYIDPNAVVAERVSRDTKKSRAMQIYAEGVLANKSRKQILQEMEAECNLNPTSAGASYFQSFKSGAWKADADGVIASLQQPVV